MTQMIGSVEWQIDDALVDYPTAVSTMEDRVAAIHRLEAPEKVWLLEHPPLYTAGTSAKTDDLLDAQRFPVYETGRGGQYTYHGPGQRVGYVMLDLKRRNLDVRSYVHAIEAWVIEAIGRFNIWGEVRDGRVGVWVQNENGSESKIAAIGVRVRRYVTFHGFAINVEPDLSHFGGIVPCGISPQDFGVTSLVDLGLPVTMADLDVALMDTFENHFPPVGG